MPLLKKKYKLKKKNRVSCINDVVGSARIRVIDQFGFSVVAPISVVDIFRGNTPATTRLSSSEWGVVGGKPKFAAAKPYISRSTIQ